MIALKKVFSFRCSSFCSSAVLRFSFLSCPQILLLTAVLLAAGLLLHGAAAAREIPAPRGYVNDYADMLSPAMESRLEAVLRSFEQTDSTQIAILTIDSLEGDPLEDFSIRTADAWKIGQQGKDNGILLLAAKEDRRVRIEVGRGLEGVLTDLAAGRITDHIILPRFKTGRFDEGFEAGIAALVQTTRGEFQPEQLRPGRRKEPPPLLTYLFFGAMLINFLGSVSRPLGMVGGAVLLPLLFLLGGSSLGLLALLLLIPAGALSGLLLPFLLAGFFRGGGYYGGGGGFGRGGGFGGGFGGGSFGGGGASGRW